jgi:polyisoprenoid-binding protein YceI
MRMVLALLIAAFSGVAPPTASGLDPARSEVRFTVTKLGYSDVTGVFHVFNVDLRYDNAHPENSVVRWRVRINSVETGERDRDRSLQSPDYFHTARYPEMSFDSRAVRRVDDDRLDVTGDLTIRGITKRMTVPVRITGQQGRRAFVSDFTLDRYDYAVRGGSVMGRLIGRTVRVHLVAVEGGLE